MSGASSEYSGTAQPHARRSRHQASAAVQAAQAHKRAAERCAKSCAVSGGSHQLSLCGGELVDLDVDAFVLRVLVHRHARQVEALDARNEQEGERQGPRHGSAESHARRQLEDQVNSTLSIREYGVFAGWAPLVGEVKPATGRSRRGEGHWARPEARPDSRFKHGNSLSRFTLKSPHFTFGFTSVTRQNRHFFLRFGGAGYQKSCDPTR